MYYRAAGKLNGAQHEAAIVPLLGFSGVCAGDYDRDGDLDLYITRRYLPNALLRNDG
ncbi:MAG: hypothetical protein IH935_05310, partial [Acidobacteria bacterium]|nr:hypothetical protein [Acidobacteriota bacterium]